MSEKDKIKDDVNDDEELMFKEVTPEIIQEMVKVYNETGYVPIVIELTEDHDIEMLVTINSMHSGGSAWINGFDNKGKFVRINEGYIKKINYIETIKTHYDEYNRYVKQAKIFHEQNREIEEQYGLFEKSKITYPYDRDVQ